MTDGQMTALIGAITLGLGGLGGLVKWCFTQWLDDRKEERAERKEERKDERAATMAVATAMTTMALKFDAFEKQLASVEEFVEEHTPVNQPIPRRTSTPAQGVRVPRPGTHHDR